MTKEMGYNVGGGCGSTMIFGLTKDGDCGQTLDGIRDDLSKLEDDDDLGDEDLDDDWDDGDLDEEDDEDDTE